MKEFYYVTIASNFIKGFNKYRKIYSKENLKLSSYPDVFFILTMDELYIGLNKAKMLLEKTNINNDFIIIIKTITNPKVTYKDHKSKLGQYIKQNYLDVDSIYTPDSENNLLPERIENVMVKSLKLNYDLKKEYNNMVPRTVSILPVKSGCQANCEFCFSTYSVSQDLEKGLIDNNHLYKILNFAKISGATRAVITGGGEPTLINDDKLLEIIQLSSKFFPKKTVLITNGYKYAIMKKNKIKNILNKFKEKGLTDLSISHHHYNNNINEKIMKLNIPIENILSVRKEYKIPLNIRLICVLQKEGINNEIEVGKYLDWAADNNIDEINFKELYVSTSIESYYHDYTANDYSYMNQISLKIIMTFFKNNNFTLIHTLPWGAPVYKGFYNGNEFTIAAYTEPSLYWEIANNISRSWNIMSNGLCLASLEDKNSLITGYEK